MNTQEQVAKLESLLARVNGRRNAPRTPATDVAAAASVEAHDAHPAAVATAPATPAPAPVAAKAPAPAAKPEASGVDVEVEVEEGVAEVDLDGIDEGGGAALSDSVADLDTVAGKDEEDVPASSRRPIQMQATVEELADAPEAKGPHPAPPESGRQVAIPPASDFEGDLLKSGVRAMPDVSDTSPPAAPVELKADVTKPAVAAVSPAVFHGEVPTVAPASFGELLDLTLGL